MKRPSPVAEREARRAFYDGATRVSCAAAIDRALAVQRREVRKMIEAEAANWPALASTARIALDGVLARLKPARKGNRK